MSQTRVIVLLGPPGGGKGTQAKRLAEKHSDWVHISTGDLFRSEIMTGSELGLSVKDILASGNLVNDEITTKVFESQVKNLIAQGKYKLLLLDGYPRTAVQAASLKNFCHHTPELAPPIAVELMVTEATVVERLSNRLVNPRTGKVYHRVFNPPKIQGICDDDKGPLVQRSDDKPETVKSRYKLYIDQRDAVVRGLGLAQKLITLDGAAALEKVENELERVLLT